MMKLLAIAIVMTLLGGCTARESDDIVKLRLTQEFAKDERTFHECADWARESLGEDASAAEQMELTNSCLHMQSDLKDRVADIKEKEEELETAKRELEETQRKLETERREREAERQRELESARQRELEALRQEREAEKQNREWEILNDEVVAIIENPPVDFFIDTQAKKKAVSLARKALRLAERKKGANHPDTATSLHNLALIYSYTREHSAKVPLLRRALAIRDAKLGKNHPDVAETLYWLALMTDDASTQESLLRRALAIKETAFGKDDFRVEDVLKELASVYKYQGKVSLALSSYHRLLPIYEEALGKNDHTKVVWVVHSLARLYSKQGNYASAFPFYRRILAMYEAKYGKDDFRVAQSLSNWAVAYMDKGDYASAEPLLRRALAIHDKRRYFDEETVRNVARLFREQSKYSQGASFLHRVLAAHKENPYLSIGSIYDQKVHNEYRKELKKICDAWWMQIQHLRRQTHNESDITKKAITEARAYRARRRCAGFLTPEEKP